FQIRDEKSRVTPTRSRISETSKGALSAGASPVSELPVQVGATVRVRSMGITGSVMTLAGTEAEVMVGNIRLRRPVEDLEMLEKPGIRLPAGVRLTVSTKENLSSEINLLGCRVEEAVERVDKFLDEASLAQLSRIRIVHGTGTGALRNAIIALLRDHPQVERFESPQQSEGGRGVTIAVLRD
ncbi:MAG TPA: Smr/MutS family protein, partial [Terriglobia bacterium]|nr:Smr/MutS family protein [Terriglobia bacterium]